MQNTLLELLKLDAQEIELSFIKASIEGEGTPQEVSDRRESSVVKAFLEKYFPFPYRVEKGNITDSYGNRSKSIDCIILNPSHPHTIDPKNNRASIIFADGVDVAIEIKPDLSNKTELHRALRQVQSVKKMRRRRSGLIRTLVSPEKYNTSLQIPTYIFSNNTYSDPKKLVEEIVNYYIEERVPISEQFDYIVINSRMVLLNTYKNGYAQIGETYGILYSETKENTLAAFLFWLSQNPRSTLENATCILSYYLDKDDLFGGTLKTFPDLNAAKKTFEDKYYMQDG